jgi:hypothetical protein
VGIETHSRRRIDGHRVQGDAIYENDSVIAPVSVDPNGIVGRSVVRGCAQKGDARVYCDRAWRLATNQRWTTIAHLEPQLKPHNQEPIAIESFTGRRRLGEVGGVEDGPQPIRRA